MAYNNNSNKGQRINEMIRVREVRLIDDEGSQMGIVPTLEALRMAKDKGLDLVEVSPNANPPVCKILDFGKYRFEQEKKLRDSKKNQKVLKLKEIRMQPKSARATLTRKPSMCRNSSTKAIKSKSRSASADANWLTPNSDTESYRKF